MCIVKRHDADIEQIIERRKTTTQIIIVSEGASENIPFSRHIDNFLSVSVNPMPPPAAPTNPPFLLT